MKFYVCGINGMVGSALALEASRQGHLVIGKSSKDLNYQDRDAVFQELTRVKPDALFIAAAKVGGIGANLSFPVDFLSVNLQIQTNLMDAAFVAGIDRVLFLASSCIYPKFADQPIKESALLTGELEKTNEKYAIAKIAGLKLIEAYRIEHATRWISAMPTNLYGPRDNFNLETAHVLPALIHRFHVGKINNLKLVEIWGDGSPLREFLHVDDLAKACMILINRYDEDVAINIGSGYEISINELAHLVSEIVGYKGSIAFNKSRPNGTPRKVLDSSRISELGWKPQIGLREGIASTYAWFLENKIGEM